jgi:hypothetical protein
MVITLKMPQYVGDVFGLAKEKLSCQLLQNAIFQIRFRYANLISNLKSFQEAGE